MTAQLTARDERLLAAFLSGTLSPAEERALTNRARDDRAFAADVFAHAELHDALCRARELDATHSAVTPVELPCADTDAPVLPGRRVVPWAALLGLTLGLGTIAYVALRAVRLRATRAQVEEAAHLPAGRLRAVTPVGDVSVAPFVYTWAREPAAVEYRLQLYDAAMHLLYSTITPDTTMELPHAIYDEAGHMTAQWQVVAVDGFGAECATTGLTTFRVAESSNARERR